MVRKNKPKAVMTIPETTPRTFSTIATRFSETLLKESPLPKATETTTNEIVVAIPKEIKTANQRPKPNILSERQNNNTMITPGQGTTPTVTAQSTNANFDSFA